MLFGSKTHACASCHNPALSWTDGLPRAVGEKVLPLRVPTLLNVAWTPKFGWTGYFRNLEAVAFGPITAPGNMNLPETELIGRLSAIPAYVDAFNAAFGNGSITRRKIELTIATFERTIVSGEAPFDRWIKTPTLRDVARRASYMRDGSVPTLEAVTDLYDRGGIDRPSRAEQIVTLNLNDGEKADLSAFLKTLTSMSQPITLPTLPR
jgi:cytochrome c peroxidase